MTFRIEIELETDGRWIAEVLELPGVLAYGRTPEDARAKVTALLCVRSQTVSRTARLPPTS